MPVSMSLMLLLLSLLLSLLLLALLLLFLLSLLLSKRPAFAHTISLVSGDKVNINDDDADDPPCALSPVVVLWVWLLWVLLLVPVPLGESPSPVLRCRRWLGDEAALRLGDDEGDEGGE